MAEKAPSIRDLARATGFSPMTVSYALRDHPKISAPTRERIQAAAEELGYRRDAELDRWMARVRARKAVTFQSQVAWLELADGSSKRVSAYEHSYASALKAGARRVLQRAGYELATFDVGAEEHRGRRLDRLLRARGIQAVFVPAFPSDALNYPLEKQLKTEDKTIVCLQNYLLPAGYHRVTPDHFHNLQLMLRSLRERGFQRIGLVLPRQALGRDRDAWLGAYLAFQSGAAGNALQPLLGDYDAAAVRSWHASQKPEVIICDSPPQASRLRSAVRARGKQLKLAYLAAGENARLSGVDEDAERIGEAGADLLVGQILRGQLGPSEKPLSVRVPGRWQEGARPLSSTGR